MGDHSGYAGNAALQPDVGKKSKILDSDTPCPLESHEPFSPRDVSHRAGGFGLRSGTELGTRVFFYALAVGFSAALTGPVRAADLNVFGAHPTLSLSAAASFQAVGSNLVVTLSNTSTADVLMPDAILTTIYFEISGPLLSLSRLAAEVPMTSTLLFPPAIPYDPPPRGVGGEWDYSEGVTNAPFGQRYVIRSVGLGLVHTGVGGLFPGANLEGPVMPDGLQYGLTSPADNPATGNSPVTGGGGALIQHEVVFTLGGLPAGFDPMASISNVQWQYGTTRCDVPGTGDQCIPVIPEPATLGLLVLGLPALSRRRVR